MSFEGTMLKWTNYLYRWKERFFVLKGSILYYYYEKNSQPKGRLYLGITKIRVDEEDLCEFELDSGTNIFYIRTMTPEERCTWLNHLKIAKLEGENLIIRMNNTIESDHHFIKESDDYAYFKSNSNGNEALMNLIEILQSNNNKFEALLQSLIDYKDSKEIRKILSQYKEVTNALMNQHEVNGSNNRLMNHYDTSINVSKSTIASLSKAKGGRRLSTESSYEDEYGVNIIQKEDQVYYGAEDDEDLKYHLHIGSSSLTEIAEMDEDFNFPSFKNLSDPLYNYVKRSKLPAYKKDLRLNIWQFFKKAIGKDINRFCVPVYFNEPLSMLQKLCENFQYAFLLNQAATEPNPYLRLAYCACFCIGGFVMNIHRTTKFFNPLLGETFEYIDNKQNFRYFAEQVSHHPAISACFAEGNGWSFYTNNNAILKFLLSGKFEANNIGRCYVSFTNYDENVVFNKPLCVARNLIFGTVTYDMVGKFTVSNNRGDICEVEMIPSTSGEHGNLVGEIRDIYGNLNMRIEGNWLDKIYIVDPHSKTKKVIWKINPSSAENEYYFPAYSFDLNNLTEEMKTALPPTDSRFRPDQRLMEYQKVDEADDEKSRLEDKQRKAKADNDKKGLIYQPMYFDETYDDLTGELIYRYKGTYFTDRKTKNFKHFPDLF